MRSPRRSLLMLVPFWLGLPPPVNAEEPPAKETATTDTNAASAKAETAFVEARQALESGDLVRACAGFAESHALEPSVGALVGLAACRERQSRIASAWRAYAAAAQLAADKQQSDRAASVRAHAERLLPDVSYIEVRVTDAPHESTNLTVTVDGVAETSELPMRVPVDGGSHEVCIFADGYQRSCRSATVPARGDYESLELAMIPLPSVMATPKLQGEPSRTEPRAPRIAQRPPTTPGKALQLSSTQWAGVGVSALGLLGAGLSSYYFARMLEYDRRADADCTETLCRTHEGQDAANRVSEASNWSTGYGVAAALLLAGGASLILWGDADSSDGHAISLRLKPSNTLVAQGVF